MIKMEEGEETEFTGDSWFSKLRGKLLEGTRFLERDTGSFFSCVVLCPALYGVYGG